MVQIRCIHQQPPLGFAQPVPIKRHSRVIMGSHTGGSPIFDSYEPLSAFKRYRILKENFISLTLGSFNLT